MIAFALATLVPAVLVAAGAVWGGVFPALALLSMTVLLAILDRAFDGAWSNARPGAEFPAARPLSLALAVLHLGLLALVVWTLGTDRINGTQAVILFLAAGLLFGQISNANAHELIHAKDRLARVLGQTVYCSLLFGHHSSSHLKVHHTHVGTGADPNTARLGESYWHYVPRAWIGSFRAGLLAENALRERSQRPGVHPYLGYAVGSAAALAGALALGGLTGGLWLLALAGFAQSQLLLSDYVQHYGLSRRIGSDGRAEPVGDGHSWNAPQPASAAMLLNAPRHSDHHAHPGRSFPELRYEDGQPTLPHSLPIMACLALVPPLWRRAMDPRVAKVLAS